MSESQDLYLGKKQYSVLGKRPVRHDGADKVTGKAIYTADLRLPGMAHGKIVRSPNLRSWVKLDRSTWRIWPPTAWRRAKCFIGAMPSRQLPRRTCIWLKKPRGESRSSTRCCRASPGCSMR